MLKSKKLNAIIAGMIVATTVMGVSVNVLAAENKSSNTSNASATAAKFTPFQINKEIAGSINIDGSSTVFPLTEAIIEKASGELKKLEVTASASGSGTGLKKIVAGEIDIAAASRKIKDEELAKAKENGIELVEIQVAIDGIAVVVNKDNKVNEITIAELNKIWSKDSAVKSWKEVSDKFEDMELKLFAPGAASGTFEYFTEKVNKKAKEGRSTDVQTSEDDNVLVTGVAGDKGALGYFGFTYYEENMAKIKALKIDGIDATKENIVSGKYPLSRPLFLYVNKKALAEKPEVKEFIHYYLNNAMTAAESIKMVPATEGIISKSAELVK